MIKGTFAPMLAQLADLAEPQHYLPPAAQEVRSHLQKTISACTSPNGKPWALRKKDGGRPLQNADKAVQVRVAGKTIIVELTGPEVFWHYGVRGVEAREVIPKEIDESLGNAIRRGVVTPFKERGGR